MSLLNSSLRLALGAGLLCLATACNADEAPPEAAGGLPQLGLMGTIPIYWGESGNFAEVLGGSESSHWARNQLQQDYTLVPLDSLSEQSLAGLDNLLLAQPRALSAAENVALDAWVRGGGHLLLFADPLMTGESRFAIGDRRRPQDVILLSPILEHWGLQLSFDEEQAPGFTDVPTDGPALPVNLPGSLTVGERGCTLIAADVLAECRIGRGSVVVLADAALLDLHEPHAGAAAALGWLAQEAFASGGENAGSEVQP